MNTSVVYPHGIARSLAHLNSGRNDVEIFVEDTSARQLWIKVISKLLPGDVRFSDPIRLGGRERVVDECLADQEDDGRRKLYIIDADMDILRGKRRKPLKHFYRLRSYCIKNYLLKEPALIEASLIMKPSEERGRAVQLIDFEGWVVRNENELRKLFIWYAVAHHLMEAVPTVSYHVGRLCEDPASSEVCKDKVNARIRGLYRSLRRVHAREVILEHARKFGENVAGISPLIFASGKSYLMPLIFKRIRGHFGNQFQDEQLCALLATFYDPRTDPYLRRRILALVS